MSWDIAVIGAGYVGMPHAQTFAEAGKKVLLVDVVQQVVDAINRGESHIKDVPSAALKPLVDSGAISATTDFSSVRDADAIVIAVPTPLSQQREPDLSYIESAGRDISRRTCAQASSSSSSRRRIPARHARCCSRSSKPAAG